MPLFIDLHIGKGFTLEELNKGHVADLSVQAKYGVKYFQILVNQSDGYVFCLMEGPDKESCSKVHLQAHGYSACNIIEINESVLGSFLGNRRANYMDIIVNKDGTFDTGDRFILALDLIGSPEQYLPVKQMIRRMLSDFEGREVESAHHSQMAVFNLCTEALDAAIAINRKITKGDLSMEVRMGISAGPPLREQGDFFEYVRKSARRLCFISNNRQITISSRIKECYRGDHNILAQEDVIKIFTPAHEKFFNQVMDFAETISDESEINVNNLARHLGMSKSQLARKLPALSGLSPNDFLKEFRLRKAIRLMEGQEMNITEITLAIGFNNPSYFSKCFRKRFGIVPSEYMVTVSLP